MPRVTRTYETDLDDLAYQISRSDKFTEIRDDFSSSEISDDEAQEKIESLVDGGACRLDGDRGPEVLEWALSESEMARMISQLYRQYLGAF
ncbi:hypothetical protein J7643_03010 [bacterium]|nr:hypothetical protein [bacterium]